METLEILWALVVAFRFPLAIVVAAIVATAIVEKGYKSW